MRNAFVLSLLLLVVLQVSAQQEESTVPANSETAVTEEPVTTIEPSKLVKPRGRMRLKAGSTTPLNESSSFVGDPDNLDPLNPARENLKEDAEPVLEDIRDVLNSDKQKKPSDKASEDNTKATVIAEPPPPQVVDVAAPKAEIKKAEPKKVVKKEVSLKKKAVVKKEKPKKVVKKKPAPKPKSEKVAKKKLSPQTPKPQVQLSPDEPDLALEKKFNDIFKKYNINPTPEDVWAEANARQTARAYEVQKGDTLWTISKILFGDANFWPKLWAVNKQGILNPHFINPQMKILFHEGTEEYSPTLSVGEPPPPEPKPEEIVSGLAAKTEKEEKEKEKEKILPDGAIDTNLLITNYESPPIIKQNVKRVEETVAVLDEFRVERKSYKRPIPIPPSIPDSMNENYYLRRDRNDIKVSVDLGVPADKSVNYVNDYVITDSEVESEIEIDQSEVQKFRCAEGRVLKDFEHNADQFANEYDIYEPVIVIDTEGGDKHIYRRIGSASLHKEQFIKIKTCNALMSKNLVFLPKDQIKELGTQETTDLEDAKIISAAGALGRSHMGDFDWGVVDFGERAFQVGQEYKSIADLNDEPNSTFQVMEKFGSFAIVHFTSIQGPIAVGSKIAK